MTRLRFLATIALLGGSSLAFAADQTILGKSLVVKDPKPGVDATKRTVVVGAGESKSPNLIVGNPAMDGATLVVDLVGGQGSQQSFDLPQGTAANGKPFWKASTTGFTYSDGKSEQGPVSQVGIKRSTSGNVTIKVKIAAKTAPVSLVPPNLGTSACVALTLGTGDRYSIQFSDGTIKNDAAKLFSVKKPISEGTCTPPTTTTTTLPDPCLSANGGCDPLTSCTNDAGSAVCGACPVGYTGSGATSCLDVNECASNNGGCSSGFLCENAPGSSQCNDINECAASNGGCDPLASCTNTSGSRTCGTCPVGYTGSGITCTDVNECATNLGGCTSGFTCQNTPGSSQCNDVNECATSNGGCGVGVVCTNTPGGHTCN